MNKNIFRTVKPFIPFCGVGFDTVYMPIWFLEDTTIMIWVRESVVPRLNPKGKIIFTLREIDA